MEYRSLPPDHEGYRETTSYAFSPSSGQPDLDEPVPGYHAVGDPRGLFDDERLLAVCKHYWFDARVRGAWLSMAGLGAVATPPERRRRGNVRRIVRESLQEYRERDVPLAALWPFDHGFYNGMGWAVANRYVIHEGPPDALAFAREATEGGQFVELDPDDADRMDEVLHAHAESYSLTVDRTTEWWRKRVFRTGGDEPYVYGWERDGALRAYLVYRIAEDPTRLRVLESAYADHEARLANLAFLSNHDSQVDEVRVYEPDADLLDLVSDPGAFEAEVRCGPMARIVDLAEAVSTVPIPSGVQGRVRVRVADPLVGWNDGPFEVAFADGETTVRRLDEGADVDLVLGIDALSQLFVGYRGIDDLAKSGDAELKTERPRELLRILFPPTRPLLREGF